MAAIFAVAACDNHPTGPQATVDGTWQGTSPGYVFSLTLQQTDTLVTGGAVLAGAGGAAGFQVNGSIVARHMVLQLSSQTYLPLTYSGDLSTTSAEITGTLDGSGFTNLPISLQKR